MKTPVKDLPRHIQQHFILMADLLLQELEISFLKVVLVDAPDPKFNGHKIRRVENRNPKWYRDYYSLILSGFPNIHKIPRKRRGSGKIKESVLKGLQRIKNKEDMEGKVHHERLREVIKEMLVKGFVYDGVECPKNEEVLEYFNSCCSEEIPF